MIGDTCKTKFVRNYPLLLIGFPGLRGWMQINYSDSKTTSSPTWRDYLELTKPGMVLMLLFAALTSMFIAGEGAPPAMAVVAAVIGVYLTSSGGCVLNSYLESDLDAIMNRTRHRPLPSNRIKLETALKFGVILIFAGIATLIISGLWLSALLAFFGVFLYVFVYTYWMKRKTVYSTIVGGMAGAFPVLVGWAAVTGGLAIEALVIYAIIMYWTPPHYWSLALIRRDEYRKAALPILPVIQGPNASRMQIGRYSILIFILTLIPVGMGLLDKYYAVAALALGILLVYSAVNLFLHPTKQSTLRYYKNSMLYLAFLLFAMLADRALL
jgi:heme o synthase